MTQWEYLQRGFLDEESLNELGRQGWELVTITDKCIYAFKRKKLSAFPLHDDPGEAFDLRRADWTI